MRTKTKRLLWVGIFLAILAALPVGVWLSLTYQPSYYRAMLLQSREQRKGKAKRFVAQSLQLRNEIVNDPTWEAVFSDQEVNAWLAEDLLVSHLADQLPPEVNEPRVLFELDRIILAFQLRQRGVESVITVVARPRVPEGNTVELTLEKIRAGILPVPADNVLDKIIEYARLPRRRRRVDPPRRLSRGADPLYAQPPSRRHPARGGPDPFGPAPARGAIRPDSRGLPAADAPVAQGPSIHLPQAEDPRPGADGIGPDLAKFRIAHQLTPLQMQADTVILPDHRGVGPLIDPPHRSPVPRDRLGIPGRSADGREVRGRVGRLPGRPGRRSPTCRVRRLVPA